MNTNYREAKNKQRRARKSEGFHIAGVQLESAGKLVLLNSTNVKGHQSAHYVHSCLDDIIIMCLNNAQHMNKNL